MLHGKYWYYFDGNMGCYGDNVGDDGYMECDDRRWAYDGDYDRSIGCAGNVSNGGDVFRYSPLIRTNSVAVIELTRTAILLPELVDPNRRRLPSHPPDPDQPRFSVAMRRTVNPMQPANRHRPQTDSEQQTIL